MLEKIKSFIHENSVYFQIVLVVVFYFLIAFIGASFTDAGSDWYIHLKKPSIQPPSEYFGYVWTFLYILLTVITSIVIYKDGKNAKIIKLFLANGILNVLWTHAFFNLQNPSASFVIILAILIIGYIIYSELNKLYPTLSYLFIIYLAWIVFAGFLNYMVLFLN